MISSTTPDKLAEIIRDKWPNLFYPPKDYVPPSLYRKENKEHDTIS